MVTIPLAHPSQTLQSLDPASDIYQFFLDVVKTWSSDRVLTEFKHLFIECVNSSQGNLTCALHKIAANNQEQEFINLLKRSCYILVNNWAIRRSYDDIHKLIQLFNCDSIYKPAFSPTIKRLKTWLKQFILSEDFKELKLFASRREDGEKSWIDRYTSYLLVSQYVNLNNPLEQREAAKLLSSKLKEKFKFDLAMYTASSGSLVKYSKPIENPTGLGNDVHRMIKMIVALRGKVGYAAMANLFIDQVKELTYREFKQSLLDYLVGKSSPSSSATHLRQKLSDKLKSLYSDRDDQIISNALLLRTCNRVIEYLTTEDHQTPSDLFILFLSEGNGLTLAILLLKIMLICQNSKVFLEARIADLIRHYSEHSASQCQWIINFIEIFRIAMTVHAENVEYNLVNMLPLDSERLETATSLDSYRIFSQSKLSAVAAGLNRNF